MSQHPIQFSRRGFLKTLAATSLAAPTIIPASVLGQSAPSNRIVMGVIGLGGRGTQMLNAMIQYPNVQFIAVCDANAERRQAGKGVIDRHYGNNACALHTDLRDLLARQDIDAVLIATGDRWHSLASILAAKAGKDIYCEKPMSMSIAESRALADTVHRYGRVFQCGTQRRSVGNFSFAIRLALTGKLGKLHTLHACINGMGTHDTYLPPEPEPAKDVFDWNMWLGPVPWHPYNKAYTLHMGMWRDFTDLGGGGIADWGSHTIDLCQAANGSDHTSPVEYERQGDRIVARYANGVTLLMHSQLGQCGARFEGDQGWVETDDSGRVQCHPRSLLGERKAQGEDWTRPVGHVQNFFECIRTRQLPNANAETAHRATTACHIANLCIRLQTKLQWDPANEQFLNNPTANRLRSRPWREPWRA